MAEPEAILRVDEATVEFPILRGAIIKSEVGKLRAVDRVSFGVPKGTTLGLVGESGSGKTTMARAILGLVPLTHGTIQFEGTEVHSLKGDDLRQARQRMQLVSQDPYGSLNPRLTVDRIVREPLDVHRIGSPPERRARVRELLTTVGLDSRAASRYPHEFSGGQRQRIAIARALAAKPSFVICDEPVSSLDVSIQAQIVNLLQELQDTLGLSFLFVGHDLSVVRHIAANVAVMYLGAIVEAGGREAVYANPGHPYTIALLSAVNDPDPALEKGRQRIVLTGELASVTPDSKGCRFRPRCWLYQQLGDPARCREEEPILAQTADRHTIACHFADKLTSPETRNDLIQRAARSGGATNAAARPVAGDWSGR